MSADDMVPRNKDKILIVDDTPMNIQILAQALDKKYDVIVARDGQRALEIADGRDRPDLILLDVMMPQMDGFETCKHLKNKASTKNIPIMFVSAKTELPDQQYGFDIGAVDYITKPFEIPLVLARIKVHLRLKHKSEKLERIALIDALTDIPNRRALKKIVKQECRRTKRNRTPLSVLMIDVDHFKAFNDTYGHGAGDDCLRTVAKTLQDSLLRPGDMVGRYGGEEFAVVLPDCDQAGALIVAEKMRKNIQGLNIPNINSGVREILTISLGVKSRSCQMEQTGEELLHLADQALYKAKDKGRNQVYVAQF